MNLTWPGFGYQGKPPDIYPVFILSKPLTAVLQIESAVANPKVGWDPDPSLWHNPVEKIVFQAGGTQKGYTLRGTYTVKPSFPPQIPYMELRNCMYNGKMFDCAAIYEVFR